MKNLVQRILLCISLFYLVTDAYSQKNNSINLLDEANSNAWRGYNANRLPPGWNVSNGVITLDAKQKDTTYKGNKDIIFSGREFEYFDLTIEWKIEKGANSGIFYHVQEGPGSPSSKSPEYQLIDDENYAAMHNLTKYNEQFGAKNPEQLQDWQKTGADYAMHTADEKKKILHPAGEWNITRIVVAPGKTEHWLNGVKLLSFTPWSKDWQERKQAGKWAKSPHYGKAKTGYIALQYHDGSLSFKNIMVKPL